MKTSYLGSPGQAAKAWSPSPLSKILCQPSCPCRTSLMRTTMPPALFPRRLRASAERFATCWGGPLTPLWATDCPPTSGPAKPLHSWCTLDMDPVLLGMRCFMGPKASSWCSASTNLQLRSMSFRPTGTWVPSFPSVAPSCRRSVPGSPSPKQHSERADARFLLALTLHCQSESPFFVNTFCPLSSLGLEPGPPSVKGPGSYLRNA